MTRASEFAVASVSDVHVGNHAAAGGQVYAGLNQRCRDVVHALRRAVVAAEEAGAEHFVVNGDLFDTHRPSPQVIHAVGTVLSSFPNYVHLVRGNHDAASQALDDDALAPLGLIDNVEVWDEPGSAQVATWNLLFVPYQPGHAKLWLPGALDVALEGRLPNGDRSALFVHVGLRDEVSGGGHPWAREAEDAIDVDLLASMCASRGISRVFAGNWHHRRVFEFSGVRMEQVGTLAPTGWDNAGLGDAFGNVAILHGPGGETSSVQVACPRFIQDTPERVALMAAQIRRRLDEGCPVHVRFIVSEARGDTATAAQVAADLGLTSWRAVVDKQEVRLRALTAASLARSKETIEGSLEQYVATKLADRPPSRRAAVLARAKILVAGEGRR